MVAATSAELERLDVVEPAAGFAQMAGDAFHVGLHLTSDASWLSVLDPQGLPVTEGLGPSTLHQVEAYFETAATIRVVLEACERTDPIAAILQQYGHQVLPLPPRLVGWLNHAPGTNGQPPARLLARFGFSIRDWEPALERSDQDLGRAQLLLRSRYRMVRRYANLSSLTASVVEHYKQDGTYPLVVAPRDEVSHYQVGMQGELDKALRSLADISAQILRYDREIEHLCDTTFPETVAVRELTGASTAVALAYAVPVEVMDG
jgi:hypothetical protein